MKKNYLRELVLSLMAVGILFTSCERDEVLETEEVATETELEEPPFTNYMVITEAAELTKAEEDFLNSGGSQIISKIPEIGVAIVSSKDKDFMQKTMKSRRISSVVPDYEIKWIPTNVEEEVNPPSIGDNEPFFYYLWGMDAVDAPEAWNAGYTGEGASVFVLDSGIDAEHPDLSPNLNTELSASFIAGEDWNIRPGRYFNHGTHVAGTIAAANNEYGVIGVAPDAELVAVKVLSEYSGSGPFSSINSGIIYAANNGADVINMSLGATLNRRGNLIDADGNPYSIPAIYIQELIRAQQRAIDYAYRNGVTVIASAGNDAVNYDEDRYSIKMPGGLNNVITVSATAPEGWNFDNTSYYDIPASYTTYGRSLVDLAAPGGDGDVSIYDMVVSAGSGPAFFFSSGTSMAAPHVSGVAALVIAKNGGAMNPRDVANQLERTADRDDFEIAYFGKGRVNAFRAVTE